MCNDYRLEVDIASIVQDFDDLKIKITTPEGRPNVPAREDIKISDSAPIVRSVEGERGLGELVNRRWSWPGPGGKPVYNFRSEGREFTSGRCLILADGFYEFTRPEEPGQKRKTKWLFTMRDHPWFCIAGIWRDSPAGEAFTMLTMDAGEDVAPYHHRQIIPLARDRWADWLDPGVPAQEVLKYLPRGSLPATPRVSTVARSGGDALTMADPHSLERFVEAQSSIYATVLGEIRRGAKRSHWMWFIFPQLAGLGQSPTSQFYAIRSSEEARGYLDHRLLGQRYRECVDALQDLRTSDAVAVFGSIDAMKLRSSLTLFDTVRPSPLLTAALERWFGGERDPTTLRLLER